MDWSVVLHAGSAIVAVAGAGALVVASLAVALGRPVPRRLIDRLLLVLVLGVVIAIVSGPVVLAGGRAVRDPLHALYGTVALLAGPVARAAAMRDASGTGGGSPYPRLAPVRLGRWMVAGGLVTLGALLRLWMTGG